MNKQCFTHSHYRTAAASAAVAVANAQTASCRAAGRRSRPQQAGCWPPHPTTTSMAKLIPGWLFQILFLGGVAVLLAGGVQWQVGRKKRTNFNDQIFIEDSSIGALLLLLSVCVSVSVCVCVCVWGGDDRLLLLHWRNVGFSPTWWWLA